MEDGEVAGWEGRDDEGEWVKEREGERKEESKGGEEEGRDWVNEGVGEEKVGLDAGRGGESRELRVEGVRCNRGIRYEVERASGWVEWKGGGGAPSMVI